MPINTRHPAFDAIQDDLKTVRDVLTGEKSVKTAGDRYLPKLGGQNTDEYEAYKKRAAFYGACPRTLEALSGAVCRKPPVLSGPEAFVKRYSQDITGTGTTLASFVGEMVREMLSTGMEGILVEHNGTRPFLSGYCAENVTNILPDGTVVLSESKMVQDPNDHYTLTAQVNYREILFHDGAWWSRVWEPNDKGKYEDPGPETRLEFRKTPLPVVPFVLATLPAIPMLPLAQANINHYLTSADLENGLHWGGIFTPWISAGGTLPEGTILKVGSSSAWVLPQNSTVGMLEVSGNALAALESRLKGKEELMASLGARLLMATKKTAETAETARINAGGEGATLSMVVDALESALTKALKILAQWDGMANTDEVRIELNRDFIDTSLTPEEIAAYLATYQAGGMSLDSFLALLISGETLPAGRTVEEEKALIDAEGSGGTEGGPISFRPTPKKTKKTATIRKNTDGTTTVDMTEE